MQAEKNFFIKSPPNGINCVIMVEKAGLSGFGGGQAENAAADRLRQNKPASGISIYISRFQLPDMPFKNIIAKNLEFLNHVRRVLIWHYISF